MGNKQSFSTNKDLAEIANSAENSRIRAEIWGDFVNWEGRRKGENGFLVNQLKEHGVKKVLDVALGDGVDTVYLLQQGFEVSCNEVDDAFRAKAIENAKKFGLTISPTTLDWRELDKKYQEDSFDAAICFGASLVCLFNKDEQLESLQQFYSLLKPGGGIIN